MPQISDRLLSGAFHLGEMPSGSLLLKDNAHYPWFLIVPHGDFVEWIDLPLDVQEKMLSDINSLSRFLQEDRELNVEKINVAAIGNIVPQFHLHIVGRNSKDPSWPAPVWGHPETRDYGIEELRHFAIRLANAVDDFSAIE